MWKPNEGGPRDTIILYVESSNAPLVVEVPDDAEVGVGAGAGAAIGGAGASVGGGAGAATGGDGLEEFDWLNEGLEGEDFANDIFGESSLPHTVPHEPNTVPTTNTPHPNTDTPHPNTDTPQPNTDAPSLSNVPPPNIDLDEEWAEPALKDDIASVDSSGDEQGPGNLEFNERTNMENVRLAKGMKFPNS